MRIVLLLLLGACGRLSFDPSVADSGLAVPDAPAVVDCSTLPNGAACDDRNVCTTTSSCRAGACVPEMPQASCLLAASDADFVNDVQGANGWTYGFWAAETDPSYEPATDFVLGVWDTNVFVPPNNVSPFLYLAWWGTHPDAGPSNVTVRRWTSNAQGPAKVRVQVSKGDTSCGDGVGATLVVDGTSRWHRAIAFDNGTGFDDVVDVELAVGTFVELHVAAGPDDSCDTTDSTVTISSP
ncbi:MAG TPA: hypothetical protein VMZ53_00560 [Kofleriaceae bacterium]|nr:hypothetical protein [Kofleriaceae bacterium]